MSLRYKLKHVDECDCEDQCAQCAELGHDGCWQRTSLWRRLWVLWKERKEKP